MSAAFLLASKDAFFNYGFSLLSDNSSDIRCFEYRDVDSAQEMLNKYHKVYLICDKDDYFSYCFLMEQLPVICLYLEQVSWRQKKLRVFASRQPSPVSVFNNLTDSERKIVYLYFFKRKKIKEIATITQLKENNIYYKIRSIKLKLGAESTRKLPILLKKYFIAPNM